MEVVVTGASGFLGRALVRRLRADGTKVPEYVEISGFVPKAKLNTLAILQLVGENEG